MTLDQIVVGALVLLAVIYLAFSILPRGRKDGGCAGCPTAKRNRRPPR